MTGLIITTALWLGQQPTAKLLRLSGSDQAQPFLMASKFHLPAAEKAADPSREPYSTHGHPPWCCRPSPHSLILPVTPDIKGTALPVMWECFAQCISQLIQDRDSQARPYASAPQLLRCFAPPDRNQSLVAADAPWSIILLIVWLQYKYFILWCV